MLFGCATCSPARKGVHDVLTQLLDIYTGTKYLILVGDDRIVPFARLADRTTLLPESSYTEGTDLTPTGTTVGQALAADSVLSDDPLGVVDDLTTADLTGALFLPDLAVGRLVETPSEITTSIATFVSQDGVLDLSLLDAATGHKLLVTGYDFLLDTAKLVRLRFKKVLGQCTTNPSPPPPASRGEPGAPPPPLGGGGGAAGGLSPPQGLGDRGGGWLRLAGPRGPFVHINRYVSFEVVRELWRATRDIRAAWRRLKDSPGMREALAYRGVSFADLSAPDLAGALLLQLPWAVRCYEEMRSALRAMRPAVLCLYAESSGWGRAALAASRAEGVRTVGLQHGILYPNYFSYLPSIFMKYNWLPVRKAT